MPHRWRNRYAAGKKLAVQGYRYFKKYGKVAEGFFLVWSLLAAMIILGSWICAATFPEK